MPLRVHDPDQVVVLIVGVGDDALHRVRHALHHAGRRIGVGGNAAQGIRLCQEQVVFVIRIAVCFSPLIGHTKHAAVFIVDILHIGIVFIVAPYDAPHLIVYVAHLMGVSLSRQLVRRRGSLPGRVIYGGGFSAQRIGDGYHLPQGVVFIYRGAAQRVRDLRQAVVFIVGVACGIAPAVGDAGAVAVFIVGIALPMPQRIRQHGPVIRLIVSAGVGSSRGAGNLCQVAVLIVGVGGDAALRIRHGRKAV